jgi:hypothetical protein
MKTRALLGLVIAGLLVVGIAGPGEASVHWRGGVYIGVGPWWGHPYWGPYPYWWYPPPYYYPPTVVVEPPPVYIEQPPPAPAPPPPPTAYWYYCMSAGAYYPSAQTCPEDWIKVPARP